MSNVLYKITFFITVVAFVFASSCKKTEEEEPTPPKPDDGSISGTIYEPLTFSKISNDPGVADYYITGVLSLESELTIDSGVVIEMGAGASIVVKTHGTIMALGTADKPITITGRSKNRGFWKYIMINSTDPRNELRYVNIEYGGGDASNDGAIYINAGGYFNINNCNIRNNRNFAVVAAGENSTLSNFTDNVIEGNEYPLKIRPNQIPSINPSNTFTNNDNAFFYVLGGKILTPSSWAKKQLPFIFRGATVIEADLSIAAGVQISFDYASSVRVTPTGSLKLAGTSTERIVLNATEPIQGFWHGIVMQSRNTNNVFAYTDITHAGGSSTYMGALYIGGSPSYPEAMLTFSNCNINNSASWGAYVQSNAELIDGGGNSFSNNIFGNIGP